MIFCFKVKLLKVAFLDVFFRKMLEIFDQTQGNRHRIFDLINNLINLINKKS